MGATSKHASAMGVAGRSLCGDGSGDDGGGGKVGVVNGFASGLHNGGVPLNVNVHKTGGLVACQKAAVLLVHPFGLRGCGVCSVPDVVHLDVLAACGVPDGLPLNPYP